MRVFSMDCLHILPFLEDESFDALVTDPPAGIGFMGLCWDSDKGGRDSWIAWLSERMRECLRVLKPGAHGLVWALPRTSHWTALALEQAGFDVRDRVSHLFGTGFPKGGDISKSIDRAFGVERDVVGPNPNHRAQSGVEYSGHYSGANTGAKLKTRATSPEAKQWEGWGVSLKPACEDWWLVRKPFKGPTFRNVLEHGTGALNIDACRIGTDEKLTRKLGKSTESESGWKSSNRSEVAGKDGGRWPAHVVFSGDALTELERQVEGVSRFFYCPKASQAEKTLPDGSKNKHPTTKSVELMRWLTRLVTPPGGHVLDPFCGSGTTGVACKIEGFSFTGCEMSEDFSTIARKRLTGT